MDLPETQSEEAAESRGGQQDLKSVVSWAPLRSGPGKPGSQARAC